MKRCRSPLYVIVNHPQDEGRNAFDLARIAIYGGTGMLQFRTKKPLSTAELSSLRELATCCRESGVPLVVNDLPELAKEIEADGVHVGLTDISVAKAREIMGPVAIIGATTPTVELAVRAEQEGASYVAVGAMYPSPTKPEKPVLGLERLRAVSEAVSIPVCGIGGITAARVPELLAAGADLVAVISAVSTAVDPLSAVQELVRACYA
ncbi:MAG: thiamine phosphate synthase [Candidatus Zipacnadales bacterium]